MCLVRGEGGCEGSDNSEVRVRDDFRFFTPLRSVQNDKGRGVAFGMTEDEGAPFRMTE